MAASAKTEKGGFWRGFLLGLVLAAAGLLALALAFPPVPATPPEIDPAAASGPAAPASPALGAAPEAPSEAPLGPVAPGPLLDAGGAQATPPSLAPVAPPQGAATGPSLVPAPPQE